MARLVLVHHDRILVDRVDEDDAQDEDCAKRSDNRFVLLLVVWHDEFKLTTVFVEYECFLEQFAAVTLIAHFKPISQ